MEILTRQLVLKDAKHFLRLSIPLIATYIVQASSGFVATIMLSRFGNEALAAGALVSSVFMTIIVFMFGLLAAVSVLVAQNHGSKYYKGIRMAVSQGFILALFFTIPMSIVTWFASPILHLSGQSPLVIAYASRYLHALTFSIVPLGILVVQENLLIGIGKTKLVLLVSLVEVPLEILLCYALVFGKFGLPKCGIAGLGYGFVIVYVFAMIALWWVTGFSKTCKKYHIYSKIYKINWHYIFELVRIGAPIGFMYIIEVAMYMAIAFMMGHFGADALAAHQITMQYGNLSFMIIVGVSNAITVQVGQAAGRLDRSAIARANYVGMSIGAAMSFLIMLAYFLFPEALAKLDINIYSSGEKTIIHLTAVYMALMSISQFFDNLRFTLIGSLRGLKDTRFSLYVSIIAYWLIGIPACYILAFVFNFKGAGLWYGISFGIIFGLIILWIRFHWLEKRIDLEKVIEANVIGERE